MLADGAARRPSFRRGAAAETRYRAGRDKTYRREVRTLLAARGWRVNAHGNQELCPILPVGAELCRYTYTSIRIYTQYQLPAAKHPLGHPRAPVRGRNDRRGPERRREHRTGARVRPVPVAALSDQPMVRRYQ